MQLPYNTVKRRAKSIGERGRVFVMARKEMFSRLAELMLITAIFFGLGVLYAQHMPARTMPLSVEIPAQVKNVAAATASDKIMAGSAPKPTISSENKEYMASKNGSKYYLTTCKSTIKEANKVYFKTKEDAEKAGFTPSQTCFK